MIYFYRIHDQFLSFISLSYQWLWLNAVSKQHQIKHYKMLKTKSQEKEVQKIKPR